ncbi:DUF4190 domain-containing protein [Streptomyces sp. NPDC051183]|uniref:DUF4190 domain-containing protein n=1 Tax=unclassified Streptomyces TaxID=2593676 RepID=UPI0034493880
MTDQSPEPRDPWAPPEQAAVDLGKDRAATGAPGDRPAPSVHEQQTMAGMPGVQTPAPGSGPGPAPVTQSMTPPAYGYPAQPDPAAYAYPGPPPAPQGYGYQGQPGYAAYPGQAPYGPYGPQPSNGFGTAALVLGIISVVACITSFFAIAIGIAAVVFGALGRGKANRGESTNGGMALAGIILGAVGIVLGGLMLVIAIFGFLSSEANSDEDAGYDPPSSSQFREKV